MFIREFKTKNKNNGKVYLKHKLVESVRINDKPRQRTVLPLGILQLPKKEWKKLAHALEYQLAGQTSLLESNDKYIDELALSLISNNKLSKKLSELTADVSHENPDDVVPIDPDSISCTQSRPIGAELVCNQAWDLLKFDQALSKAGFSGNQRSIAKALVFGRLVSPGSERHIIGWFRKRSSLPEFPGFHAGSSDKNLF